MPRKPDPRSKGIRTVRPHIRPNGRKLRTKENAELICGLIADGAALPDVADILDCVTSSITDWIREDGNNGGAEIAAAYARAVEVRAERMAEQLLDIADDERYMAHPALAAAMVTQQRLKVDTRKWLLSKMLPRKYGDRIEVGGDPSAPLVTRIELVAVEPASHARVIDNVPDDGADDG